MDCWPVFTYLIEEFPFYLPSKRYQELLDKGNSFLIQEKLATRFTLTQQKVAGPFNGTDFDEVEQSILKPVVNEADKDRFLGEAGLKLLARFYKHYHEFSLTVDFVTTVKDHATKLMWLNAEFFDSGINCQVTASMKNDQLHFVSSGKVVTSIKI